MGNPDPETNVYPKHPEPPHDQSGDANDMLSNNQYALSGKIMMTGIVILFFVVVLMVSLHLYTRWYLLRRRRQLRRRRRLVLHNDTTNPAVTVPRGLDGEVLKTLPLFVYSEKTHPDPIECAVCLSEFEENETGRVLPKCNHSFHIECIDMWFHSHSTCPLCRSLVETVPQSDPSRLQVPESGSAGSSSSSSAESSFASSRKPLEVTIDIPARSGSFNDESPASQFRSPVMTRMLSFTRILSRERRPPSPSPRGGGCGCSSASGAAVAEVDVERGRDDMTQLSESNRQ